MKRTRRRARLVVSADGENIVSHVGARLLSELADAVDLTVGLSVAMAPTKQRRRGYDRGEVLVDLAVMIADGGDAISDLVVLRNQPELFGEVASTPTAWRTLEAVDTAALARIATARAQARRRVWAAGADPGFYVIDIDATLITAHSDKQGAAPTYKRGFGHHPLLGGVHGGGRQALHDEHRDRHQHRGDEQRILLAQIGNPQERSPPELDGHGQDAVERDQERHGQEDREAAHGHLRAHVHAVAGIELADLLLHLLAAGIEGASPSHEETKREGAKAAENMKALITRFFRDA